MASRSWTETTIGAEVSAGYIGTAFRTSLSGAETTYRAYGHAGTFSADKLVAGAFTLLENGLNYPFLAADKMTAAMVGTQVSIYQNGNLIVIFSDSSLSSGGAGFEVTGGSALSDTAVAAWAGGAVIILRRFSLSQGTAALAGQR